MYKDQTQITITIDNTQFDGYTHPQVVEYFKTDVAAALADYVSGTVRCHDDGKGDGDKGSKGGIHWDFTVDGSVDSSGNAKVGGKITIGGKF